MNGNKAVTATFKVFTQSTGTHYKLTMASPVYGSYVSGYLTEGTHTLTTGTRVSFSVTPKTGYVFSYWKMDTDYGNDGSWDKVGSLLSSVNPDGFMSGTANIGFRVTPVFTAVSTVPQTK